ncbi:MAG: TIGR00289 family protein, partial [archaeon]
GPMWHKNPERILEEEIESGHEIIITQVSCEGLNVDWLGKKIDLENFEILKKLSKKYGFNIHGEGGEYETFVLDGPLFKKKIRMDDFEILHGALTGMLKIKKVKLVRK